MIIYHPAFDLYHCAFRQLVLLHRLPKHEASAAKLELLDFYFLFPREIADVELTTLDRIPKAEFRRFPQYESIQTPSKVFFRLQAIFHQATRTLIARAFVDQAEGADLLRLNLASIPEDLLHRIQNREAHSAQVLDFLVERMSGYTVTELRGRTGLQPTNNDRK